MTKIEMLDIAKQYGLVYEVQESYAQGIAMGMTEEEACSFALNEWDL